jgi:hypothetical protein
MVSQDVRPIIFLRTKVDKSTDPEVWEDFNSFL